MSIHRVVFTDTGACFTDYPYPPAIVCRTQTLAVTAIRDADDTAAPPEIRTQAGERLFVSAEQRDELKRFCQVTDIPLRQRPDVWGDLLEPFLDTDFTIEHHTRTLDRLDQCGLSKQDVATIRARVGPIMRAYNALHWDWYHLGLDDLLDAALDPAIPQHLRDALGNFSDLYRWAMTIANSDADQTQ